MKTLFERMSEAQGGKLTCDFCKAPAITELDGDALCQRHADAWCRAEEEERRQHEEDNGQLGVGA